MKKDLKFLKEKLVEHFDEVFETLLINEIAKYGHFAMFKKGDILMDIGTKVKVCLEQQLKKMLNVSCFL